MYLAVSGDYSKGIWTGIVVPHVTNVIGGPILDAYNRVKLGSREATGDLKVPIRWLPASSNIDRGVANPHLSVTRQAGAHALLCTQDLSICIDGYIDVDPAIVSAEEDYCTIRDSYKANPTSITDGDYNKAMDDLAIISKYFVS